MMGDNVLQRTFGDLRYLLSRQKKDAHFRLKKKDAIRTWEAIILKAS
jgi:hypothetical protein